MKTRKFLTYIILGALIFTIGCEDDLLQKSDPNNPTTGTFYQTEDDAILAINSAYSALQFFGVFNRYWNYINSARSDESQFTAKQSGLPEVNGLDDFTMIGTVKAVEQTWIENYKGILRANTVLKYIPGMNFTDQALKRRILGEAYFLRAIYHFNLIQNFSEEIPIYTKVPEAAEDFFPYPAEQGVIYDTIEADLIKAKNLLPNVETYRGTDELGRISKGAAVTLLGKVYLYREKYQQAADELYTVIDGSCGHYELVERFRDNHVNTYDPDSGYNVPTGGINVENNVESIFEVQYELTAGSWYQDGSSADVSSNSEAQIIEQEMTMIDGTGSMWWNAEPTQKMINEFEKNPSDTTEVIDPRYFKTFWCPGGDKYLDDVNGTYVLKTYEKYITRARRGHFGWRKWGRDWANASVECDVNVRVLRLADVYLMFAECLIQNGVTPPTGAETWDYYIDLIRDRARNDNSGNVARTYSVSLPTVAELLANPPTINGIILDNPTAIIRHERMVELACEGHRWQDILRWGIGEDIFPGIFKPWLPIYTTDLMTNPNLKPNSSN